MPPVDEIARQVVSETLGRISQDLVRLQDAEHAFREELRTLLWTIMTSYWQETIVMVNRNRVSCLTSLPVPLGQWRSRIGLLGWVAELIPAPWKLKKLNKWEPYIAQ
jgi:hypothetical protein